MKFIKLLYMSSILLLFSQKILAGEYVRPPSGPYQSTVIIHKNLNQSGSSDQVYKFPSDILIQVEQSDKSVFLPDRKKQNQTQQGAGSKHAIAPVIPPIVENPVFTQPERPTDGNFSRNPWDAESLPGPGSYQGNGYQENWSNQQFSYPQQSPYGYYNQNNFMNYPFNGMPSPWTAMPMQPFFSGR